MKKRQITYGVYGMMEYQASIRVGKKNVSVHFTDGSMSAFGTTPATYTTDSIIMQNAIEASADYKRGRIQTVTTIELADDLVVMRNAGSGEPQPPTMAEGKGSAVEKETVEGQDQPQVAEKGPIELTQVEFSCNDDAKDYLEQNFGYVRSKLKNREDILSAGRSHGIEIYFT